MMKFLYLSQTASIILYILRGLRSINRNKIRLFLKLFLGVKNKYILRVLSKRIFVAQEQCWVVNDYL